MRTYGYFPEFLVEDLPPHILNSNVLSDIQVDPGLLNVT